MFEAVLASEPAEIAAIAARSPGAAAQRMAEDHFVAELPHMLYQGDTPLHLAAAGLRYGAARALLTAGAPVNAVNRRGATALHYACDPRPSSRTWDPAGEAKDAIRALRDLGVPKRVYTVIDMEDRVDKTYVENFGQVLQSAGYKVWVYGQASTVFGNPRLNGYWVADYAGTGAFMYDHRHVRATQYAEGENYDSSTVRDWTYNSGTWWV